MNDEYFVSRGTPLPLVAHTARKQHGADVLSTWYVRGEARRQSAGVSPLQRIKISYGALSRSPTPLVRRLRPPAAGARLDPDDFLRAAGPRGVDAPSWITGSSIILLCVVHGGSVSMKNIDSSLCEALGPQVKVARNPSHLGLILLVGVGPIGGRSRCCCWCLLGDLEGVLRCELPRRARSLRARQGEECTLGDALEMQETLAFLIQLC